MCCQINWEFVVAVLEDTHHPYPPASRGETAISLRLRGDKGGLEHYDLWSALFLRLFTDSEFL
jgi:hypothetical protein